MDLALNLEKRKNIFLLTVEGSDVILPNKKIAEIFGEKLRFFRVKQGLTQQKLAKLANISHQSVSHMELGKRKPNPEWIPKLAAALDIDPIILSYTDYTVEQLDLLIKLQEAFRIDPKSPHFASILATLDLIVKK